MDEFDHRSLGARLDLYHIAEDAPGMPFWHPRGHALYRALEDFVRERMRGLGFREVRTPQLLPRALWERSGHWGKFRENMFSVDDPERPMALKPMSCPCHVELFNQGLRSWRQLPMRYAEFGACHRNGPSGAMHGLMRTRSFVQDDAHVFCRESDVRGEVVRFIGLLRGVYAELGFDGVEVALSTRPAERYGEQAVWDEAEGSLLAASRACGLEPAIQPGEGAFYGPKLEFALRDRLGRSWQCGTVQLDYVLPERLGASYVDENSSRVRPVMIHHAVLGSMERMIGILLEHHGGALPLRFAPEQVAVMPLSCEQEDYAAEVEDALASAGIRAVALGPDETLSRRIVSARERMVPLHAVVGRREAAARSVALTLRDGSRESIGIGDLAARIAALVDADRGVAPVPAAAA
jgi:threonyl-tRNA synthetase